jgi:predicted pyridoxine 5'-phosphate oxidase superfamily flavin-nucleotide-binding protein
MDLHELPGSRGEHRLQEQLGSASRARAFYLHQVLDHLNPSMREFLVEQEMFFVASADGRGECDCSFRAGEKGFVRVLGERAMLYPEYRGNGVHASLGNITENAHVGLLFIDFFRDGIGLHVNGRASVWTHDALLAAPHLPPVWRSDLAAETQGPPQLWVLVEVEEAYIHCSKHVPLLARLSKEIEWGTDNPVKKGGDYFHAKECARPWAEVPPKVVTPT